MHVIAKAALVDFWATHPDARGPLQAWFRTMESDHFASFKMIGHARQQVPKPQAILKAWLSFKEVVGVTSVRTEADYRRARVTIESLLEQVGDDETHPLADVLAYLGDQVKAYEDAKFPIPQSQPHEVLRFLMDQHGLKQEDLADCAPQSRISDILNRRRAISKEIAKRLARRFKVRVDLFL